MDNKEVVFVNKKVFNQIDWDKDIVKSNVHKLSQDTIVKRLSMALQVFIIAENSMNLEKAKTENEKSNVARMLQYFYAKYVYYHAHFYKKSFKYKVDLKPNPKESYQTKKNFLGTKIKKSNVPLKVIKELESMFEEHITSVEEENKKEVLSKTEYYNQVKDLFTQVGLKVVKPRGRGKEEDRDTICFRHDGVPYHISMMRESIRNEKRDLNKAKAMKDVSDEFISRYHDLIKRLYLETKKLPDMENLWVMEGGGMQHQAFFGNESGYIGILYLGMKGEKDKDTTFSFAINSKKFDNIMKNWKIEGIKIKTYKSIWGNK